MAETRIKIKVGQHEFEAEGPVDLIREQFDTFKKLVADAGVHKPLQSAQPSSHESPQQVEAARLMSITPLPLEQITRNNGRLISLDFPDGPYQGNRGCGPASTSRSAATSQQ